MKKYLLLVLLFVLACSHAPDLIENPAVINPNSTGYGSSTYANDYERLLNAYSLDNSSFFKSVSGVNYSAPAWFTTSSQCTESVLHGNCGITGESFENYCLVTDEFSQYALDLSMTRNASNEWKAQAVYNTITHPGFNVSPTNRLKRWYFEYDNSSGVSAWDFTHTSDSASDADARIILALFNIYNNPSFSNETFKNASRDHAQTMCGDLLTYNFINTSKQSASNSSYTITYFPCGGTNVCTALTNNDLMYSGYYGDIALALGACGFSTGAEVYFSAAQDLAETLFAASGWNSTTGFKAPPGRAFKWSSDATPVATCTTVCTPSPYIDTPDGKRLTSICAAEYFYELGGRELHYQLNDYCGDWLSQSSGWTTTSYSTEWWTNGTNHNTPQNDGGSNGLALQIELLANQSNVNTRLDYVWDNKWDPTYDQFYGTTCFGLYESSFFTHSMGYTIGYADLTFNGSNASTPAASGNFTFVGESVNATTGSAGDSFLINITPNVTVGTISSVWVEVQHPGGSRINYTMTNGGSSGTPATNDSNLIANDTFESVDHGWTSYGSLLNDGDGYINITNGGTASSRNISLSTRGEYNYTYNFTISSCLANYSKVYFMAPGSTAGPRIMYEYSAGNYQIKHEGGAYCTAATFNTCEKHVLQIFADNTNNQTTFKVWNATSGAQIGSTCSANAYISNPTSAADYVRIEGGTQGTNSYFKLYKMVVWNGSAAGDASAGSAGTSAVWYNTTFSNTSANGYYNLTNFFATSSEAATGSNSSLLRLFLGTDNGPSVFLNNPSNNTLWPNRTVVLGFTPSDDYSTTVSCSLYTNSSGSWSVANTTGVISNGTQTNLSVLLNASTYLWNVVCTDAESNAGTNVSNYTVMVNYTGGNFTTISLCSGVSRLTFVANQSLVNTTTTQCVIPTGNASCTLAIDASLETGVVGWSFALNATNDTRKVVVNNTNLTTSWQKAYYVPPGGVDYLNVSGCWYNASLAFYPFRLNVSSD